MDRPVSVPECLGAYPLSEAGKAFFAEANFGHLIDGEIVRSIGGGTMGLIDPASGLEFARCAAGGIEDVRPGRAFRPAGVRGRPLAWARRPGQGAPPAQAGRPPRPEPRALLTDIDVVDGGVVRAYSAFIVQFGIDATAYYAGWPTKLHGSTPGRPALTWWSRSCANRSGVCGVITPWNGPSAAAAVRHRPGPGLR